MVLVRCGCVGSNSPRSAVFLLFFSSSFFFWFKGVLGCQPWHLQQSGQIRNKGWTRQLCGLRNHASDTKNTQKKEERHSKEKSVETSLEACHLMSAGIPYFCPRHLLPSVLASFTLLQLFRPLKHRSSSLTSLKRRRQGKTKG